MRHRELNRRLDSLERRNPNLGPVIVVTVPTELGNTAAEWDAICSKAMDKYGGQGAVVFITSEQIKTEAEWNQRVSEYLKEREERENTDEQETDSPTH